MKYTFELGSKKFVLFPYTTAQEKELLLMSSFGNHSLDDALELLGFAGDLTDLSEAEKKVLLYKYREISLGDEINVKFVCDKCKQGQDGVLMASDFVVPGIRNDDDVKKLSSEFTEENLHHYVDVPQEALDELDIDVYDALVRRVRENQVTIKLVKSCDCVMCGTPKYFDLSSPSYIIEIMSDDDLMTLYQTYNYLNFFGRYTKSDIDGMYPFERSIFMGQVNKTREDMAK